MAEDITTDASTSPELTDAGAAPITPEVAEPQVATADDVPADSYPVEVPHPDTWAKIDYLIQNHGLPKGADVSTETQFVIENPNWSPENTDPEVHPYIYRPTGQAVPQGPPQPQPQQQQQAGQITLDAEQFKNLMTEIQESAIKAAQTSQAAPPRPGFRHYYQGSQRTGTSPEPRLKPMEELSLPEAAQMDLSELGKVIEDARQRENARMSGTNI